MSELLRISWLYPAALLVVSLLVALLEWWRPWRPEQRQLRPGLLSDLAHLVINGHWLGVGLYAVAANLQPAFSALLQRLGLQGVAHLDVAARWPLWLQIVGALVVVDFLQWCVHRLLHRFSFLWEIHKVHHSIEDGEMDWIVSFRFHWLEVVIYKGLLYLPLLPFGFGVEAVMVHAIFGTLIGHLNHANLDLSWGPLRYVLNSPRMHIWHHDAAGDEKTTKNFGIIFSTWDWLFGTASLPDHPPARLGFDGVERMPKNILAHAVWPASEAAGPRRPSTIPAVLLLAGVVSIALLAPSFGPRLAEALDPRRPASAPQHEAGPSSQPAGVDVDSLLHDPVQAAARLALFGADAAERGYAHPEHMVSVAELRAALGAPELVVLDVRPRDRFSAGHIPRARPIDRDDYAQTTPIPGLARTAAELQAVLRARGVRQAGVVVVAGDGGPEPWRLWWQLRAHGLQARLLDGGLAGWKAAGLPTVSGTSDEAAGVGDVVLQASSLPLTWDELGDDVVGATLLDTRTSAEYEGREQHKDARRAGHIPGAVLLPWEDMLRSVDDQRLRSVIDLKERFARAGVVEGRKVVTYCQTGTRSAVVMFALWQLGRSDSEVRNYNGSWSEYSRLDLPLSTGP
ncbi:MAG: rhodanese-like domain-containing protein [Deltaproteobacteria bacterium]|nr:rhodanese-like domain-containing protein [Deltaproteobacteria bacterium]